MGARPHNIRIDSRGQATRSHLGMAPAQRKGRLGSLLCQVASLPQPVADAAESVQADEKARALRRRTQSRRSKDGSGEGHIPFSFSLPISLFTVCRQRT